MDVTKKERLLVMNGQRVLQHEADGQWQIDRVDKAGGLKPGIYNLYLATPVDKTHVYEGVILYVDKDAVYQHDGKRLVRHDRESFEKLPEAGSSPSIKYEQGKVVASAATLKLRRGLSR